jgi:hypothetical protein
MTAKLKNTMIPLNHAVLCLDCNSISDANRECPACSSRALLNPSAILDRPIEIANSPKLAIAA